uniref:Regulator of chromosome condensation n=1 Tax=Acrobeloides nanus TaxID=290746 RepID=A0A914DIE3_9BILA
MTDVEMEITAQTAEPAKEAINTQITADQEVPKSDEMDAQNLEEKLEADGDVPQKVESNGDSPIDETQADSKVDVKAENSGNELEKPSNTAASTEEEEHEHPTEEEASANPRRSTRGRKRKVSEQPVNTIPEEKEVTAAAASGRRKKQKTAVSEPEEEIVSPKAGRGRPRRTSEASTPSSTSRRSSGRVGVGARRKQRCELDDYIPNSAGERVLSCGEGEQLGHPGRTTTRKPRALDTLPDGTEIIQVAAGGVHSVLLTTNGKVYSCGMNEHGTVPVIGLEKEDSTDEFREIEFPQELKKHGKIVQITAGASFSAALTNKGSVIAWGNLRDSQGEIEIHALLKQMQQQPVIIVRHDSKVAGTKKIVKIAAGENHLVMLSDDGEVLTFGDGSMGQLGRSTRLSSIRSSRMVDDSGKSLVIILLERGKFIRFVDIFAGGFWSMARAEDGRIFACGLNNFGQLGLPLPNIDENADAASSEAEFRVPIFTHVKAFPSDKKWTHIKGVKHIVARTDDGTIYGIGNNTDNALGLGTYEGQQDKEHWRYLELQEIKLGNGVKAAGVTATLGASIAWTENGEAYSWGYDTTGQLGVGIASDDDDKMVAKPRKIESAHLNGYHILEVSIADNHSLFLAKKREVEKKKKEEPAESNVVAEASTDLNKVKEPHINAERATAESSDAKTETEAMEH